MDSTVVVLIPERSALSNIPTDYPEHITLAYFGPTPLEASYMRDVVAAAEKVSEAVTDNSWVSTREFSYFDDDAFVLELDDSPRSNAVIFRNLFLKELQPETLAYFESVQTYPVYRPHITLGYGSDITLPEEIPTAIRIEGISVWTGDEQLDFRPIADESISVNPDDSEELAHYGTPRHSGRYPWGSGKDPYQSGISFMNTVKELKAQGLTDTQVAQALGMATPELRARKAIAGNEIRKAQEIQIIRLKDKGMSNSAISRQLGIPEPTVRNRVKSYAEDKQDIVISTADTLLRHMEKPGVKYLDIGKGTELYLGISKEKLNTAVAVLKDKGYSVEQIYVDQLGNPGKQTTRKLLVPPGTTRKDIWDNSDKIGIVAAYTDNGGRDYIDIQKPTPLNPDRVQVRYGSDGGDQKDGIIELRRGVSDLSLGEKNYAQVRIQVGDNHYLKGMVMYSDNMPDGVDVIFNTPKESTGNKLDAMKPLEADPTNPFKSTIRQKTYLDKDGKERISPLNIVGTEDPDGLKFPGEEGAWGKWSKTLSSQMLSKQSISLAKEQLGKAYSIRKEELDEINSLTNPTVKKQLLEKFADSADAAAVDLKAASLPRTANHVILPIPSLKDTEVYAPNYRNGEQVALIRHPHGGIFEIPVLTVNNKNPEAKRILPQAEDAIGITAKVAARLSGADFDGDTVLVIPTDGKTIQTAPALKGLQGFDPHIYQNKSLPPMSDRAKQQQMGIVSNLITDMTLRGATNEEIARAVRHSMVVIDAQKHKLDYKQSRNDHAIASLEAKYQPRESGRHGGASTLISRAKGDLRIPEVKLRKAKDGGPVDPNTGELIWEPTGRTFKKKVGDEWVDALATIKVTPMSMTRDAHTLSSGTAMERVYANHANSLKALANAARKEAIHTPSLKWSPSAKKTYSEQVSSLNAKLNVAEKNKPLERQAQHIGLLSYRTKAQAQSLDKDQAKKLKAQELAIARSRVGAKKQLVDITPIEWEAIQAGAISNEKLKQILQNTDISVVKQYAMPRSAPLMSSSRISRAKSMLSRGYTQAEVADALGVSTSTLAAAIKD